MPGVALAPGGPLALDPLFAYDTATGQFTWTLSIPSYDSVSSPILSGNMVYFDGLHPCAVYAVDLTTQRSRGKRTYRMASAHRRLHPRRRQWVRLHRGRDLR